jgi:hypothetical protein
MKKRRKEGLGGRKEEESACWPEGERKEESRGWLASHPAHLGWLHRPPLAMGWLADYPVARGWLRGHSCGLRVVAQPLLWPGVAVLPSFCFLFWCFVLILSLCIFLEMVTCYVMIGGQKTNVFCYNRIAAALLLISVK